ncbi:efflux RND transporter periplasmic adaptor subunit [Persicirhabdus sediminis]|uniref:Efflux RND transporter periplasmic adaptor subunit n=1 Tax=Persicirhabdus sediminis TaxID=454144 RepID=A0A8J7MEH8_9BACT|nr:efflux RND transporter periplasmic adaptor subunit [Persicirhabdus sediminis]MBK1791210.1 efflux RND transporter periplasmic adaptor subunit [Persicirhabdus sediminis]
MSEEEIVESTHKLRTWVSVLLGLIVLAIGAGIMLYLFANGPVASKKEDEVVLPSVEVIEVLPQAKQIWIKTQGKVQPKRVTQAAAEVAGRITYVADRFEAGGYFAKGDVLLKIDPSDYQSALADAQANLAQSKLLLAQEQARAEQAVRDWAKLGRGREASDLVLRKPQLAAAEAGIQSAAALVQLAENNLSRTELKAPYDCRIDATYIDLGSYAAPGARLADLHSSDDFEIRLPITLSQYGFLDLDGDSVEGSEIVASSMVAGRHVEWPGTIVRGEGKVDPSTMTLHLVAKLKANTTAAYREFRFPPVGMFLQVQLRGGMMERAVEIPRQAVRDGDVVYIVDGDGVLDILPVKLIRVMRESVLIENPLPAGAQLIISPMDSPVRGSKVLIRTAEDNPQ